MSAAAKNDDARRYKIASETHPYCLKSMKIIAISSRKIPPDSVARCNRYQRGGYTLKN